MPATVVGARDTAKNNHSPWAHGTFILVGETDSLLINISMPGDDGCYGEKQSKVGRSANARVRGDEC